MHDSEKLCSPPRKPPRHLEYRMIGFVWAFWRAPKSLWFPKFTKSSKKNFSQKIFRKFIESKKSQKVCKKNLSVFEKWDFRFPQKRGFNFQDLSSSTFLQNFDQFTIFKARCFRDLVRSIIRSGKKRPFHVTLFYGCLCLEP